MKRAKFVLRKSGPHSFFELVTANDEILLHNELHRWRGAAEDGVVAVKVSAPDDARYQRKSDGKKHYFVLTSAGGEVLCTSGMYETAPAMEKAIQSVKRNSAKAQIDK